MSFIDQKQKTKSLEKRNEREKIGRSKKERRMENGRK